MSVKKHSLAYFHNHGPSPQEEMWNDLFKSWSKMNTRHQQIDCSYVETCEKSNTMKRRLFDKK